MQSKIWLKGLGRRAVPGPFQDLCRPRYHPSLTLQLPGDIGGLFRTGGAIGRAAVISICLQNAAIAFQPLSPVVRRDWVYPHSGALIGGVDEFARAYVNAYVRVR